MAGRILPNLGLIGFYAAGDDGWGAELSLGLLKLSVLAQGGVISKVNADPGAPADGDVHIFSGTHPTNANKIAIRDAGAWVYVVPVEGWMLYNRATNYFELFDGAAWAEYFPSQASDSEGWTGTAQNRAITPKKLFDLAATQALVDGATINWDGNTGLNFSVTLGGNRTLANPTNMKTGQSGIIFVTQDATGGRTLSYASDFRFPGGTAANLLSTGANAVDAISYYRRSSGLIMCTLSKGFAA